MDPKFRKDFLELFNEAFEGLIIPAIEGLREELHSEIKKLRSETEAGFQRIENRLDFHAQKDADLERRVKKLESSRITA